jgi:hypothetical protein
MHRRLQAEVLEARRLRVALMGFRFPGAPNGVVAKLGETAIILGA